MTTAPIVIKHEENDNRMDVFALLHFAHVRCAAAMGKNGFRTLAAVKTMPVRL